ncbi:ABC transporter, ATP-binding protein [Liquorilactobacillus sucicola DSM 21376 = JCM 15457]|uniref:ABC transporter, ATP-binding protein n=1 Tax=Liquorilactobacillus sucicola DSM 21376 = JCM 15457 TaxID=1423806 RepID=A0A0R2DNF2_9LACO|nr:ATP-binding cassette domain-containing protein [Liquorilactobacillus sucicola]KRN05631.1 ABC transporter, ATP-binding protein [Liquorilactobacillus sucicola DSM 21376 = JCM 15457]
MSDILTVEKLNKSFGKKKVLKDVSFNVQAGKIVGLVGPNGAGKTTIMKAILGLFEFQSGKIVINGREVSSVNHQALSEVGALIEYPGIYPFLTGMQHLELFADNETTRKEDIQNIIEKLNIGSYINRKAKAYSLGMKQKLGIALALLNKPKFVILDEPMNGLDPKATKELRNLILELAKEGTTFLISSHILSELEKLVDEIVVIDNGKIVKQTSMEALSDSNGNYLVLTTSDDEKARKVFATEGIKLEKADQIKIRKTSDNQLTGLIQLLSSHQIDIVDVQHEHNDLETSLLDLLDNDQVKE